MLSLVTTVENSWSRLVSLSSPSAPTNGSLQQGLHHLQVAVHGSSVKCDN